MFRNTYKIALILYITGLLLFHAKADFSSYWWAQVYYLWQKFCDLFFILSLYQLLPDHRNIIRYILYYTIVRVCFQISEPFLGTGSNHPYTVNTLFLVALSVVVLLTLRQTIQEWKSSS